MEYRHIIQSWALFIARQIAQLQQRLNQQQAVGCDSIWTLRPLSIPISFITQGLQSIWPPNTSGSNRCVSCVTGYRTFLDTFLVLLVFLNRPSPANLTGTGRRFNSLKIIANLCTFPSLTIVIPPRPSVPFEESFRISVTQSRREAFRQNPLFIDLCHALPEGATFTRGYLMDKLGGAGQGVVAR